MSSPPPSLNLARVLMLALVAGLVFFCVVAAVLVFTGQQQTRPDAQGLFALVGAALFAVGVLSGLAVPAIFVGEARRRAQNRPAQAAALGVLSVYTRLTIVRGALLEAPGLFGGVGLLLTGNLWFALLPLASSGLLLATLPSEQRFRAFAAGVFGQP